ncbi:carbohydrate ABC transporter membrane protein 1, CUT1 family (TC 3.A.1.1.-) [Paenibacillus sp. 1_12]|uniref:carbohydrate ABC transporter permease n=1 Tax=Paenibacillus sp. 1_12 TaxID=1566278 RepID=UPI0008E439A3|nr:sugar ABC transporter permease [Paenibacillus sp. 1_12]SFL55573.1 carbohydrate ABC transporter membrane protein 1, CUT1 family (TC 3.A.1.1.-) [Paenibacillus sp. 1_12]
MQEKQTVIRTAQPDSRTSSSWKWRSWSNYVFILPGLLFMVTFMVFPIIYNIVLSFQNVTLLNLRGEHEFVGWQNYQTMFQDPLFTVSFSNSAIFTSASILFQFTIGFALALFFNRKFPGRDFMRSIMLLGWMMPIIITATLFKWMFAGDFGVINHLLQVIGIIDKPVFWLTEHHSSLAGTIMANIWIGIPFNMVILLSGLQSLPDHLYEAAKIDGASRFRQFTNITLPLMKPTIMVLLMLGIIYTFKVFDLIYIMTGGGPVNSTTVFPLYAYRMAFTNYDLSMGATAASFMFFVLIALASVYLWIVRKEEHQ